MLVKFKADTHQYFSEDDRELMSVSSFIKSFEPSVDWTKKAKNKSKKLKEKGIDKSYKEILEEWDNKRQKGTEAGTILHSIKEAETIGSGRKLKISTSDDFYKYSFDLSELENGYLYPELMIYDFDHMLCGQSDEVEIINNTINIYDFKTDKEISFKGYQNKWEGPEKLLDPVSHLTKCNGNIYSLKMSTYMYLVWKATKGKFKPGKIILKWCPIERDEDAIPILHNGKPKQLKEERILLPYRKAEVLKMLTHLNK